MKGVAVKTQRWLRTSARIRGGATGPGWVSGAGIHRLWGSVAPRERPRSEVGSHRRGG